MSDFWCGCCCCCYYFFSSNFHLKFHSHNFSINTIQADEFYLCLEPTICLFEQFRFEDGYEKMVWSIWLIILVVTKDLQKTKISIIHSSVYWYPNVEYRKTYRKITTNCGNETNSQNILFFQNKTSAAGNLLLDHAIRLKSNCERQRRWKQWTWN